MIQFLNPLFLLGLAAASLPILIHLLTRRRAVVIDFSSLLLLRRVERETVRRVRLRQVLLLVLRTAVLVLLALALARPLLRGLFTHSIGAHEETAVVLILDNSLSMGWTDEAGRLFDRARERARQVLGALSEADDVALLLANEGVGDGTRGAWGRRDEIGEAIAGARLTQRGTRLGPALERALELLTDRRATPREVHLFSDLQEGSLPDEPVPGDHRGVRIVVLTERAARVANAGVTGARLERVASGGVWRARAVVSVRREGAGGPSSFFPRLLLGGAPPAVSEVALMPGEEREALFPIGDLPGEVATARVEIEPDGLVADNERYLLIPPEAPIRCLLIDGADGAIADPLRLSLEILARPRGGIELTVRREEEVRRQEIAAAAVLVVGGSEGALRWAREAVLLGRGVLIAPTEVTGGAGGPLGVFLEGLACPLKVEPPVTRAGAAYDRLGLGTGSEGPLGAFLAAYRGGLERLRVHRHLVVRPAAGGSFPEGVWTLPLQNGDPALVVEETGGARVALWALGTTSEWSTLPESPLFLPFLDHLLRDLASGPGPLGQGALVGKDVLLGPYGGALESGVEVKAPSGRLVRVPLEPGEAVPFRETDERGIYEVRTGARLLDRFAVNPDPAESRIEELPLAALGRAVPGAEVAQVRKGEGLEQKILTARGGREISRGLLALALGLLVFEHLLANRVSGGTHAAA